VNVKVLLNLQDRPDPTYRNVTTCSWTDRGTLAIYRDKAIIGEYDRSYVIGLIDTAEVVE
jgi:hypothetical protein